jgi:hypothetical protein
MKSNPKSKIGNPKSLTRRPPSTAIAPLLTPNSYPRNPKIPRVSSKDRIDAIDAIDRAAHFAISATGQIPTVRRPGFSTPLGRRETNTLLLPALVVLNSGESSYGRSGRSEPGLAPKRLMTNDKGPSRISLPVSRIFAAAARRLPAGRSRGVGHCCRFGRAGRFV